MGKSRSLSELMSKADLKFEKKQFHRKVRDSVATLHAQKAIEKDPQILMESGTEPVTEHAMKDITEPVTEPALGAVTESAMVAVMKPPETIWKSIIARSDRVLRSSNLPLTSEKEVRDSVAALHAQKAIEKDPQILMESGTEPVTEHAMEDITEPVTEPALGAVTESAMVAVMKPPETIWKSIIARSDRVLRSSNLPLTSEKEVRDSVAALSAQKAIEKKKKLRSRQKKLKAYDLSSLSEFLPELKIPRQPSPAAEFKLNCKSKQKLM
ncbi:uncharacterized protein LOC142623682 isoform X2 [Castanea sativa]|uniref:uncharacterized protein LOC142623682 isoform X2 n=1 Tax=Castanea sativa TaxID=21020 RepID=UPI003F64AF7C